MPAVPLAPGITTFATARNIVDHPSVSGSLTCLSKHTLTRSFSRRGWSCAQQQRSSTRSIKVSRLHSCSSPRPWRSSQDFGLRERVLAVAALTSPPKRPRLSGVPRRPRWTPAISLRRQCNDCHPTRQTWSVTHSKLAAQMETPVSLEQPMEKIRRSGVTLLLSPQKPRWKVGR